MAKKFRDFKSARDFVRKIGVKSAKEWRTYCKSGNKPEDIPSNPERTYKNKGYLNLGDWLGTGSVAPKDIQFRDFESARDFVISLKLKGVKEWYEYCKSGNKHEDIPTTPYRIYKNKGWIGYGDWLGTGNISDHEKQFLDFNSAREFARSLGLKNFTEWQEYCKSGNKPEDIPSNPERTYKNKGYLNLGDWLGTGSVASYIKQFRDFESAREFARSLGLKNFTEWQEYCKSGNKPEDIPSNPERTYKNKGYLNLGDWLGTGSVALKDIQFRDFESAREFARSLKLKSQKEWLEYCKSGNKPEDIPTAPQGTYKNLGYISFGDWLGTGRVASQKREFLPFKEAREEVRKLAKQYNIKNWKDWQNAVKKGLIPKNIPSNPNTTYSKRRDKTRD